MTRFRPAPALALAAGLLLAAGSTAQPPLPGTPAKPPVPPAELPVVPKSAAAFVSLKVSDVLEHPDLEPVLEQLRKTPEALEGVTELFGVAPREIDRVTLFWPAVGAHGPGDPVVVVTTRAAYNEARVLRTLNAAPVFGGDGPGMHRHPARNLKQIGGALNRPAPDVRGGDGGPPKFDPLLLPYIEKQKEAPPPKLDPTAKPKGNFPPGEVPKEPPGDDGPTVPISTTLPGEPLFYELDHGPFDLLVLSDERTLVFLMGGSNDAGMVTLLAQLMQKKGTGPLADAIAAAGNHTLAAGLSLTPLLRGFDRRMPPGFAPYVALAAAKSVTLTGDLGKTAKLTLTLAFDDAAAAKRAAPVLEEGLKALAEEAGREVARMKGGAGWEKAFAPLVEAAAAGLGKAAVKAEGTAAVATTDVEVGPAAAKAVAEFLPSFAGRKAYALRTNNLKQIGLALHNYHDAMGRLPTNVYGPTGEPLLSWRVQILPYLEEDNAFRQFKMDEPWDGPTNKKLIEKMPKVFEAEGRDAPKGHTVFQAFVSPDPRKAKNPVGRSWLEEGGKNPVTIIGVTDGTSNTLAVVEARTAVVWSKPDDLPFGEKLPPLGAEKADRFAALFLDGSVRALPTKLDPTTLRRLIDISDGQVIPDLGDRPRRFPFGFGGRRDGAEAEALVARAREALGRARAEAETAEARLEWVTRMSRTGAARREEVDVARVVLESRREAAKTLEALVALEEKRLAEQRAPDRRPEKR